MKKIFKWLIIVFSLIVFVIIYARYIGTMGFITKEYTLYDEKVPQGFDGMKIVHFSDLHYNRAISISKIKKIIKEINLINPDIVVFTGDLIDKDVNLTSDDYEELTKLLKDINAKYGKYSVMGNHDIKKNKDKVIEVFNDSDFKYLENSYDIIYSNNADKIFIGGIGDVIYKEDDVDKTMEYFDDKDDIDYRIILVHEPDISDKIVDDYSVNLILAGHSHNGQIRLPIIGAISTPVKSKKYYDEHYVIDGTDLYISSGIGVSTTNFRLFNHPSINFYRINKKTSE